MNLEHINLRCGVWRELPQNDPNVVRGRTRHFPVIINHEPETYKSQVWAGESFQKMTQTLSGARP